MIRVIDRPTIESLISYADAFAAVWGAFVALAENRVVAPHELAARLDNGGEIHIKGAHIEGDPWGTFKFATGAFPGSPNAGCSLVFDASTGAPVFLLDDGGWLTEMRTAAAGAVAADALARDNATSVAVLGTGVQARFQLAALRDRRQVDTVHLWGRNQRAAEAMAEEVGATAAPSAEAAVRDAEIVVTATSARTSILEGPWLRPGTHVTAMGADTADKRELATSVFERATVIAADDVPTCREVGELHHVPEHWERAVPLAELVSGQTRSRQSENDITVADLCGLGVEDAAIGAIVARRVLESS